MWRKKFPNTYTMTQRGQPINCMPYQISNINSGEKRSAPKKRPGKKNKKKRRIERTPAETRIYL